MSTRSSARRLLSPIEDPEKLLSRKSRSEPSLLFDLEEDDMAGQAPPQGPIPDLRSMEELLQAPTDGVGDAIVVPPILANQFELKIGLLNLVTAIAFHGFENDDPHSHIRRFTKITQIVKLNNVPGDVVKLLLFSFSLEGAARTWLEKEPPNSITTWNDLVSKFVNRFFPPSKTTNLRNEITRFQQRFGETFSEAWDRFKDLLNKCPHHGFSPLHQIDTFYNSLNQSDQDSLNSAANGNFLTKNTQEALTIIENKSKVQTSRNKPQVSSASGSSTQDAHVTALTKQVEALLSAMNRPVNSIQNGCETCGGPHAYYECQAAGGYTQEDVYATTGTYNAGGNSYQPQGYNQNRNQSFNQGSNNFNQAQPNVPSLEEMMFQHMRSTEAKIQQMQTQNNQQMQQMQNHNTQQIQQLKTQNTQIVDLMSQMQKVLHERPQGALPSNTEPNPREQVNSIMTRSGLTTAEPSIPPHVPPTPRVEVEKEPETLMDEVHITSPASTAHVPPPGIQPVSPPKPKEDPKPNPHQPKIPYPSRLNKTKLLDKNDVQVSKFLKILKQLHFDISLMDALTQIPKFTKVLKDLLKDKEKLEELANTPMNVECSAILLNKADRRVPIILGRPFLRTARALVDLYEEKLNLRVRNEEVIDKSISGSTTFLSVSSPSSPLFETSDSLLEEFADELALLDPFPSGNEDNNNYGKILNLNEKKLRQLEEKEWSCILAQRRRKYRTSSDFLLMDDLSMRRMHP
ncbi:reverse transcriptase domain-containing protein [Tanacetum coccineum]